MSTVMCNVFSLCMCVLTGLMWGKMFLQSIITKHVDSNDMLGMASLDLSATFGMVNTKLLIKRLGVIGIPSDVVCPIRIWLTDWSFYVTKDGKNSILIKLV